MPVLGAESGFHLAGDQDCVHPLDLFLWFRATFPRYRYDQIMRLGWKVFIPVTLVWLVVVGFWMMSPWTRCGNNRGSEWHETIRNFFKTFPSRRARQGHGVDRSSFLPAQDHCAVSGRKRRKARVFAGLHALQRRYPNGKSAASPANCARRSARPWRSPLSRNSDDGTRRTSLRNRPDQSAFSAASARSPAGGFDRRNPHLRIPRRKAR